MGRSARTGVFQYGWIGVGIFQVPRAEVIVPLQRQEHDAPAALPGEFTLAEREILADAMHVLLGDP
jgi:hypothetical protein